MYLIQRDDFAIGLLDFSQLGEKVPEPRLGDNVVGRKDAHAVQLRGRVAIGRQVTANDLVFVEACCMHVSVCPGP